MEKREHVQENKMGVMPVAKLLLTMSVPMMISMLVQALYNEGIATRAEELLPILHSGNNGTIKILGTEIYDIDNREITLDCAEAARKIVEKKIHIAL